MLLPESGSAQFGANLAAGGAHIGTTLQLRLENAHHLAHILHTGRTGLRHGVIDKGIDFGIAELGGEEFLEYHDFRFFGFRQFGPVRITVLCG